MGTKVFATYKDLKLVSDERDVMVPSRDYKSVQNWCKENGIDAKLAMGPTVSSMSAFTFGVILWRVKDEQQRILFVLRWS